MKLKANNFSGKIELPYQINWSSPDKGSEVMVYLTIKSPCGSLYTVDTCVSTLEPTYKENVKIALLRAEEKWGLDLLQLDLKEPEINGNNRKT